jgi:molybdopterin molybdotransferase
MISVQDALNLCLSQAEPFAVDLMPLDDALGLVLAEDVLSDIDSPPFDKALMDGFAVQSADVNAGAELRILETITAGQVPTKTVEQGTCTRIMTGAPIPSGADAVVRIEVAQISADGSKMRFGISSISRGESILKRGAAMRQGDTVLRKVRELRPQELGVLAELGKAEIPVRRRPTVAVLATGDELVPVAETPKPGQIRNSNETMLAAQIQRAGGVAIRLGIAKDNRPDLAARIQKGLECDLLILSGGVSAGSLDLVPSELANAGVKEVFHQVNVKPGKPVWFGVKDDGDSRCLVFGLPGNPVSSMVCFELFARPVMRKLMGHESPYAEQISMRLAEDFHNRGNRPVYHPAEIISSRQGPSLKLIPWMPGNTASSSLRRTYTLRVKLVPWVGSSDLRATVDANALAVFPEGDTTYKAGTWIDVIPW